MKTILIAAASFSICSITFAASAEKTLCHADETPLFQCTVKTKQVSLCSAGASKTDAGKLQYRFGTDKRIELSYPDTPQPAAGKFFRSETAFSGGGEEHIRFKNGDYDYILFQRTVRTGFGDGPNNPEFSAGIMVVHGDKVNMLQCKQDDPIKAASQLLPEEEFNHQVN